jgi:hypothetical protein
VFITKTDLPIAFEAIRKVGDYFNKPGGTSAGRMELIPKKVVEVYYGVTLVYECVLGVSLYS